MGGKGRKRREKNYRVAHGAHNRLPPPPASTSLDALPTKLRKLMSFTHSSKPESAKVSVDGEKRSRGNGGGGDGVKKKSRSGNELDFNTTWVKGEDQDGARQPMVHDDEIEKNSTHEKRKKKRKRKPVDDLRFETAEELGILGSKRKERKKKRLEEMKKKHKKGKAEENLDFPGREEIKFGEVVEAPPKLVAFPKASRSTQDASKERLRLKAVESYRNQRGWTSRPGIHVPLPVITPPSI